MGTLFGKQQQHILGNVGKFQFIIRNNIAKMK